MAPAAPMARFSVDLSRLAIDFGRVDEAREIIEQALVMARSGGFAPVEGSSSKRPHQRQIKRTTRRRSVVF